MCKAHMTLDDLGGALSVRALCRFVRRLDHTSALWRETHEERREWVPWLDGTMVAPLLASLIDVTNYSRWEYAMSCSAKGHAKPRKPRRVEVPWRKEPEGERRIGRGAVPIADFEDWWKSAGAAARGERG